MDGADYYLTSDDINYFALQFDMLCATSLDLLGKVERIGSKDKPTESDTTHQS
jgi:hypothetical protein